jgi:hypothetical protein
MHPDSQTKKFPPLLPHKGIAGKMSRCFKRIASCFTCEKVASGGSLDVLFLIDYAPLNICAYYTEYLAKLYGRVDDIK